jgi:predicted esterase YcpF (UPF0227 family)
MLLYLHGFNSSAASFKARLLRAAMARRGREAEFVCPDLPDRPSEAIALVEAVIARERACLVGSSLGGFYATYLAEKHDLRAVLVNPAVRPYELLCGYVGTQKNLYTGIEYEFTAGHLAELRALEVEHVTPERYLVIVTTDDEVLDYRDALGKYRGAERIVVEGGDHGFSDFERYLEPVLGFCLATAQA